MLIILSLDHTTFKSRTHILNTVISPHDKTNTEANISKDNSRKGNKYNILLYVFDKLLQIRFFKYR